MALCSDNSLYVWGGIFNAANNDVRHSGDNTAVLKLVPTLVNAAYYSYKTIVDFGQSWDNIALFMSDGSVQFAGDNTGNRMV